MTTLHVGTFDADAVISLLPREVTVIRDGDSWEEWGEGINHLTPIRSLDPGNPYQIAMSQHPEHLVIRDADSTDLLSDVAHLLKEGPGLLMPMTYENQMGTIACITPDDDWSEPYYTLEDTPARRWLQEDRRRRGGAPEPEDYWSRQSWMERVYIRVAEEES